MIEHRYSEAAVFEDDYSIALGFIGNTPGGRAELAIQWTKKPDEQDVRLRLDTLYLDYGGSGGYDLVRRVSVSDAGSISVFLKEEERAACGIDFSALRFSFEEQIDNGFMNRLRLVCNSAGIEFDEGVAS